MKLYNAFFLFASFLGATLHAQQSPPPPAAEKQIAFAGCVTEIPTAHGNYVLATPDRCLLLDATDTAARLLGHLVELKGVLSEASGMLPDTLHVRSIASIGSTCTKACTLPPPGSRGVHGSERPGHEGGTPGAKSTKKTDPQP